MFLSESAQIQFSSADSIIQMLVYIFDSYYKRLLMCMRFIICPQVFINLAKLLYNLMESGPTCLTHKLKIDFICLDQLCNSKLQNLFCYQCMLNHNKNNVNHRVVQYPEFVAKVTKLKEIVGHAKIQQHITREFKLFKDSVLKQLYIMEEAINQQFLIMFNSELETQIISGQISQLMNNPLVSQFIKNPSSIQQIKEQSKQRTIFIMKQLRILDGQITDIIAKQIKYLRQFKVQKGFSFSLKNKHPSIQVVNQKFAKKSIAEANGHSHLVVCSQNFNPLKNQVCFKIQKMSKFGCVAIGACLLDKVSKSNYFRCWQLDSGTYSIFVNTFGTVKVNHSTLKQYSNAKLKDWTLITGDQIKVQIDYTQQSIIFTKNNKNVFKMPINIDLGSLYPFVGISYNGDLIQIL